MASVYIRRNDQILLLYRQGHSIVNNLWIGSAGGHFEKDEINNAKDCILRELYEELSLTEKSLKNLTLRYITLRYTDNEIRQNYYFFADLTDDSLDTPISNEGITQWHCIDEINHLPMPISAKQMIEHYIRTGQYDDSLYAGISSDNLVHFFKL